MVEIAIVVANLLYLIALVLGIAAPIGIVSAIYVGQDDTGSKADRRGRSKEAASLLFGATKAFIALWFFVHIANAMMTYIGNLPR